MIEELRDEKLIEKVGGRFQLSALIQKRLAGLYGGAQSFVKYDEKTSRLETVIQEIVQDKIYLDFEGKVCARNDNGEDLGPIDDSNFKYTTDED